MTAALSPSSLDSLWHEYAITRSVTLRNKLVEAYLYLARINARKTYRRLPRCVQCSDLLSDAYLALIGAVERFDPARKTKFTVYAAQRIRGAILDGLRERDAAHRSPRHYHTIQKDARECLRCVLGRDPTDDELRDELARRGHNAKQIMDNAQYYHGQTSLDVNVVDSFQDPHPDPYQTAEARDSFNGLLRGLNTRERELLRLRYSEGKTHNDIAIHFGLTQSRITQIHTQLLQILKATTPQEATLCQ